MTEHLYAVIIVITLSFISLKTSFLCYYKPYLPKIYFVCPAWTSFREPSRYILHILHGHPSGTHLLILNLKPLRDSDSFISLGTKSHIFKTRLIAITSNHYRVKMERKSYTYMMLECKLFIKMYPQILLS